MDQHALEHIAVAFILAGFVPAYIAVEFGNRTCAVLAVLLMAFGAVATMAFGLQA